MWKDLSKFFTTNKNKLLITITVIMLGAAVYQVKLYIDNLKEQVRTGVKTVTVEKVVEKIVRIPAEPKQLDVKSSCTPQEAKVVLSGDGLLKDKNWFIVDLNTFRKTKDIIKDGKHKIYYSRFGAEDTFITIFKPVSDDGAKKD